MHVNNNNNRVRKVTIFLFSFQNAQEFDSNVDLEHINVCN